MLCSAFRVMLNPSRGPSRADDAARTKVLPQNSAAPASCRCFHGRKVLAATVVEIGSKVRGSLRPLFTRLATSLLYAARCTTDFAPRFTTQPFSSPLYKGGYRGGNRVRDGIGALVLRYNDGRSVQPSASF